MNKEMVTLEYFADSPLTSYHDYIYGEKWLAFIGFINSVEQ